MSFDVGKWKGTWKHARHSDNYHELMEKLGIPPEATRTFQEAEFSVDPSLSGNVLTSKTEITAMGKTVVNSFTLGEEGIEEGLFGKKARVVWTVEGESLVAVYPDFDGNGLVVNQKRHFVGDNKFLVEIAAGGMEGWVEFARC